jgi:hypothetical protein
MASKLTDDQIKWVLSIDANQAQQEIQKLSVANKDLKIQNDYVKKAITDLEAQGQKNSDTWKRLSAEYKTNSTEISNNNLLIKEHTKTLGLEAMTMSQLRKTAGDLQTQLNNTSKSLAPEVYSKLEKELQTTKARMVELNEATKQLPQSNAQLKAELGTLPGIFGEIQTKIVAGYQLIKNKTDEVIGTTTSLKTAFLEKRAAVQAAKIAEEEAVAAELLLKTATAEGTATIEMAAAAETARAAATNASTVATSLGTGAMKIFKIALASTGIGLLVIALGALVTYFTSTNEGVLKFKMIMSVVNGVIQEGIKLIGSFGKIVFDVLSGNFKDVGSDIKAFGNDISNFSGNVKKAADEGKKVAEERAKLNKQEREWKEKSIELQGKIGVLEKQASKQSALSATEKVAAAKKAQDLSILKFKTDYEIAKKNEDLVNREQKLKSKVDKQAIADARDRTAQLKANYDNEIQSIANKRGKAEKGLQSEQQSSHDKQLAAQKKFAEDSIKLLEDENLRKVNDIKQKYINGDIKTEFEYNQQLLKNQENYDNIRKLKLQELLKTVTSPELRMNLQKQIDEINAKSIDTQIQHNNKIKKILLDADPVKLENLSYDDRLRELGLFGINREDMTKEQLDVLKILETQHNKSLKDINDKHDSDILKSIKDIETSGQTALEIGENTKILMLKEALSKRKITQVQFDTAEKQQAVESAKSKLALAEANIKAIESAEFNSQANKDEALKAAQLAIEKLKNELKAAGIELTNISKKTGKDISAEMTTIFGSTFSELGSLFTSFYTSLDKLKTGDLSSWSDWASAIGGIVQGALSVATQANDQYYQMKAAALESDKQSELTAAGDSAEKRQQIEQEYAQKELDLKKQQSSADTKLKIAQAVAAGGLAIVQAYAQLGPIGGTIAALLIAGITALQISTISKQNSAIQATTLESSGSSSTSANKTGTVVVNNPGYADGGYTGDGEKYEVAGYAHKREYVVAQEEMSNPVTAAYVRKIDNVKQQRSKRNPLPAGFSDGGYTGDSNYSGNNVSRYDSFIVGLENWLAELKSTKIEAEINYWEFKKYSALAEEYKGLGARK